MDLGAARHEGLGYGATDAPRRPGNESDTPREIKRFPHPLAPFP
jgi:hypothetical protein